MSAGEKCNFLRPALFGGRVDRNKRWPGDSPGGNGCFSCCDLTAVQRSSNMTWMQPCPSGQECGPWVWVVDAGDKIVRYWGVCTSAKAMNNLCACNITNAFDSNLDWHVARIYERRVWQNDMYFLIACKCLSIVQILLRWFWNNVCILSGDSSSNWDSTKLSLKVGKVILSIKT